ncbi:GNAT family N-acetyltransferase [Riemerella columbipharyngis]|uniref:N-acetylglutamate synthase, GNAT family n=1 Tax=Riemerella columbipharyngis TaxID=1071918 RepID=A0A1G7AXN9_9FLAO|nr:GNAT family N-acetyltransferase [Riemerella columbipharyngis]SDE18765.1 N-acetylglutamate synthase, GNAT family [Riemerella columbipharyngis]
MEYQFRKAKTDDEAAVWEILKSAIHRRRLDGSSQWQDGYPNMEILKNDIRQEAGWVLVGGEMVCGYVAIYGEEPAYDDLKQGNWLSNGVFIVIHRLAVSEGLIGRGLAQKIFEKVEEFARQKGIKSIKADTNFDNYAMLHIFKKMGYSYCGKVYFRGSERLAYEKLI